MELKDRLTDRFPVEDQVMSKENGNRRDRTATFTDEKGLCLLG